MVLREHKLKILVTLNGVDFGLPSGGSIKKTTEIPTATLKYPNPHGSLFQRFSPRDVFRIYVGKDAIDTGVPNFVGYPTEGDGGGEHTISLISRLHACETEYLYIDEYDNYDGWEVSRIIQQQLEESDMNINPALFGGTLQGTNPSFRLPLDFRKPEGITRYQLIKAARDIAYDVSSQTGEALRYYLYEHGNGNFMFIKQKPMIWNNEWRSFRYSRDLLSTKPRVASLGIVNRQTVFTPEGVPVTYNLEHDQQMTINGIHEGAPIKLDSGNYEDAFNRARLECLTKRAPRVTSTIKQLELIEAVPGITIIRIDGAPDIMNGFHRVVSTTINFSSGLEVICELEKSPPLFGKEIISLLQSNA